MALINCPECGKEISDKSKICVNCGFPISEYLEENKAICSETKCRFCGATIPNNADYCDECGMRLTDYVTTKNNKNNDNVDNNDISFDGVYRPTLLHGLQEVYCPRCGSSNCSHYKEQETIPEKSKTTYSVNLNPLKPFTLLNKKDKCVQKASIQTKNKFICNKCGKIFY